jgi:hypothetical protein
MTETGRGIDDVVRELRGTPSVADEVPALRVAGGRRAPRRRSRVRRAVLVVAMLLAGVGLVVAAGSLMSRGSTTAGERADGAATSWTEVVERLDRARVGAWVSGSSSALAAVDVPGSAADRVDRAAATALRAARLRPRGLTLEVAEVGVVTTSDRRATLRVVDRRPPYELVDARDRVVHRVDARDATAWHVELERGVQGWRVLEARTLTAR